MTTHVALPLNEEYLTLSDDVILKLRTGKASPQANATVKSSKILVETMLQILVGDLTEQVPMKPFAKKVIVQVGSIVQKTIGVLIEKVISKLHNRDLEPFVDHFKKMEIDHHNTKYLGFELDKDLAILLNNAFSNIDKGETAIAKQELSDALLQINSISIELFLKLPMSLIKLGLISRKVVDITGATIEKVVPPAINKIIGNMDQDELTAFKNFIAELIITTEESMVVEHKH